MIQHSTLGYIQIQVRRLLVDQPNVVHETYCVYALLNFLVKMNRKKKVKILHAEFSYKDPGEDRDRGTSCKQDQMSPPKMQPHATKKETKLALVACMRP